MNIENLVRDNIKGMKAYSTARHEYGGSASVFLDANENPFPSPLSVGLGVRLNRYPDPSQKKLKEQISIIKGVPAENIFLGNGSDEAIDLLIRIFCRPGKDRVIICPPTYGMYEVCAAVNEVKVKQIPLLEDYQLDMQGINEEMLRPAKLIFICSPNNPTGNTLNKAEIKAMLNSFNGIVVIDEAYIDFSEKGSFLKQLFKYPNLIVLQTFSKAWGLAGLRLGLAFASAPIISYLNKVKYPYNISAATQQLALEALGSVSTINNWAKTIVEQREWLRKELLLLSFVQTVYPSDANFLLVKMKNATIVYTCLLNKGIIVRDRSSVILCDDCLRITVGTPEENKQLLETLKSFDA